MKKRKKHEIAMLMEDTMEDGEFAMDQKEGNRISCSVNIAVS